MQRKGELEGTVKGGQKVRNVYSVYRHAKSWGKNFVGKEIKEKPFGGKKLTQEDWGVQGGR